MKYNLTDVVYINEKIEIAEDIPICDYLHEIGIIVYVYERDEYPYDYDIMLLKMDEVLPVMEYEITRLENKEDIAWFLL